MKVLDLRCPSCGAEIPFDDVNLSALVAKCGACRSVFDFSDRHAAPAAMQPPGENPLPARPHFIELRGAIDEAPVAGDYRSYGVRRPAPLTLRWRWFKAAGLFELFFAIAWDGFLVFWYGIAFASNAPWIMFVFPIAHLAVGIGITKRAVANLVNTTEITVEGDTLSVRSGPVRWPWEKPASIPLAEVRQLAVLEKRGSKGAISWGVVVHLADGSARPLLDGLETNQHAAYVERAIEQHLGLPDEPWRNAIA